MSAQAEQWRVSTIEGIFETDLDTLKQWIAEGCVLPTDKVSKGKLSWIEAGRAPMLRAAFNGELPAGSPPPVDAGGVPPVVPEPAVQWHEPAPPADDASNWAESTAESGDRARPVTLSNACHNHQNVPPEYVCKVCAACFCAACPRFVSQIPVCPLCGEICKPYVEVSMKLQSLDFQSSGFGFADFARALRYPLDHKMALIFGAAIYGFLQLAGFRGKVVAFVIMFGCISHVISQVAWGRLNRSFLPDFSAFSMWDDVAVPIGLGIGITVVTWGPMIAITLALVFGVIKGPASAPFGAAPAATAQPTAVSQQDLSVLMDPEADPKKLEEANAKLNRLRPGSQIAEEAERSKQQLKDPTSDLRLLLAAFQLPVILVLLLLLSIVWGIFYYPMALSVAGYTERFGSVVNPLVGLDTIRRMGSTYFKAFGMVILIQLAGFVASVIVAAITAPLAMPFFGNLPANFIDGSLTFYFNLVIACLLGLSLHKCADRLGIEAQ